jgi:hypothetical protein
VSSSSALSTGALERLAKHLDLGVPADEPREPAPRRDLQSRARRTYPGQLMDLDGLAATFHRHRTNRLHGDEPFDLVERRRGDRHRARARGLFYPRGEMRRLTDGRVIHVKVVADGADHDFARVEADTDLHRRTVRAPRLLGVPIDRFLHLERGIAGADGVVLVRNRCAEERHDPVAHHLVHRALVAVDGLHHVREDRVEDLARFLGIAVGEQLHRALEIGEQDGHLLPLAFERRLRAENSLGEMLRRVGLRRRGQRYHRRAWGSDARAAFQTELRGWREVSAAVRTLHLWASRGRCVCLNAVEGTRVATKGEAMHQNALNGPSCAPAVPGTEPHAQ